MEVGSRARAQNEDEDGMSRGPFKVDLRLVDLHGEQAFDVGTVEFARSGSRQAKNTTDHGKTIIEGKQILDSLVETCRLGLGAAKGLKAPTMQICGKNMHCLNTKQRLTKVQQ